MPGTTCKVRSGMRQILLGIRSCSFSSHSNPRSSPSSGSASIRTRHDNDAIRGGIHRRAGRTTRSATFASVLAVDPVQRAGREGRPAISHHRRARRGAVVVLPAGTRAHRAAGGAARDRDARLSRRARSVRQHPPHADRRQRAAARGLSARRRAERAQSRRRSARSKRSRRRRSRRGPTSSATWGSTARRATTSARPMPARSTSARDRGSARDAGRHGDARRRRDLRRQADQRALQLHVRRADGGRRKHLQREGAVPRLDELRVQASRALPFATSRAIPNWKDGVLAVAGVKNFSDAARFMGCRVAASRRRPTGGTRGVHPRDVLSRRCWRRRICRSSREQGILPPARSVPRKELLFRLIDKKSAFEWQQGVLVSFDAGARRMRCSSAGSRRSSRWLPTRSSTSASATSRLPLRKGSWIGGELVDFRAEGGAIPMLVYRINFANPAADRYSRLALWQVHKTKAELDTAFRSLAIGEFSDMRVVQRGASERLGQHRDRRIERPRRRPRAAAAHAARPARQPVLLRHRAQRGRRRRRRDVLRPRLGPRRRHVPGRRLRHGARRARRTKRS